jgi:hypothetical protein
MQKLIDFLNARLAADQRYGETCLQSNSRTWVEVGNRTIRETEAKQAILARHSPGPDGNCPVCVNGIDRGYGIDEYGDVDYEKHPCWHLRTLAAIYIDHPEYRQEWAA